MAKDSVLVDGVTLDDANVSTVIYSAAYDTVIKAITASNATSINAAYTLGIAPDSESASGQEIPYKIVVRQKSDPASPLVNHVIPKGGSLVASTTSANSISFRVTGRVLS